MYHAAVPTASTAPAPKLKLASGVGLVAANMIGTGVFISAGFMAQSMGPGHILLAWLAGAALALCGTAAYGAVARMVPRSGGEYRYLSELLHPAAGYLAGWASLLVGFSAPIAAGALAAGAFAATVVPGLEPRLFAAGAVVLLTAFHALGFRTSFRTQNGLILVKALILATFVGAGLLLGRHGWPAWTPPHGGDAFPIEAFAFNQLFIAFAFSGWNAAVYAAEEFEAPERTVPRAMAIGALLVSALYLVVNWVFVANLDPDAAFSAVTSGNVTLGHAVMTRLVGEGASAVWSAATVVVFLSSMSAMIFLGPRVYAAMARDGFLPRALAGEGAHPPRLAVVLQGALALAILLLQKLQTTLAQVGAVLVLFAALTALGLVVARVRGREPRPSLLAVGAALVYVVASGWLFKLGLGWCETHPCSPAEVGDRLLAIGAALVVGLGAWAVSRGRGRAAARG